MFDFVHSDIKYGSTIFFGYISKICRILILYSQISLNVDSNVKMFSCRYLVVHVYVFQLQKMRKNKSENY